MGKIRVATLGGGEEKEQRRRADARRQTKKSKKEKVEGLGLHGGERVAVVEGTDIKPEFKKLVAEVEEGEKQEARSDKKKTKKAKERSRRYKEVARLVDRTKLYPLAEAISLVKKTSLTKFDGTVELHVNLNPASLGDTKGDFRGSVSLPHGTGKEVKVVIADDAVLGAIESGKIDFDVLVAHPSMMPRLAKLARILGPKGLMPNPKTGTVGENPERLALSLSKGQINFKAEPGNPIVHLGVGKISFEDKKLMENIEAILSAIGRGKIARATLAPTMGPGVKVAIS
ncbi:50S ribosomal protein L1 [Candidatus Gottesmanbacteria bacterium]|nr:50S ribosomal protein L1 [Candidatus Gottesmanbacteria bacterium]